MAPMRQPSQIDLWWKGWMSSPSWLTKNNENILVCCQDPHAVYNQGIRLIVLMSKKLHRIQGGIEVTQVWIASLKHLLQGNGGELIHRYLRSYLS
jgi:hypothetical protein